MMRVNKREIVVIFLFLSLLFSVYLLYNVFPNQNLKISFMDVGQGDSILFRTPTGGNILIDGGRDKTVLTRLGSELPITEKNIDIVIATHDDSDHITGLIDVIKNYNVKILLYSIPNSESVTSKRLIAIANLRGVKIIQITKPMIIKSSDGLIIKVMFPVTNMDEDIESNDASIVTQFVYGKNKFLLTGDLPQAGEVFLVNKYGDLLQSNILKLGHHGSDTSSNPEFLQTVHPEVAIVSAGKNNSYGHPHQSVLDLFSKFQIPVLRTDELGTINFSSNGLNIWRN